MLIVWKYLIYLYELKKQEEKRCPAEIFSTILYRAYINWYLQTSYIVLHCNVIKMLKLVYFYRENFPLDVDRDNHTEKKQELWSTVNLCVIDNRCIDMRISMQVLVLIRTSKPSHTFWFAVLYLSIFHISTSDLALLLILIINLLMQ